MGQHKTNPTAILAKQGKLPPKEKSMSKSEMMEMAETMLMKRLRCMFWNGDDVLKEIERRQQEEDILEDNKHAKK